MMICDKIGGTAPMLATPTPPLTARHLYGGTRAMPILRNCELCGSSFATYHRTQVFCSRACRDAVRRKGSILNCAVCRTAFYRAACKRDATTHQFCSRACKIEWEKHWKRERVQHQEELSVNLAPTQVNTGSPCIHGHDSPRWRGSRECVQCSRERKQLYRQEHREKIRAKRKAWREANREKVVRKLRALSANKRARVYECNGTISAADVAAVFEAYGYACLACGSTDRLALDHVIPLAAGGPNLPSNLQPLCISCNSKKGNKATDYRDTGRIVPPEPTEAVAPCP